MVSAHELVEAVGGGLHLQVSRRDQSRVVRILHANGDVEREEILTLEQYEPLFEQVVALLAEGHPSRFRVHIDMDFYGKLRAEIRLAPFGLRVARLDISPRHIALLDGLIAKR